MSDGWSVPFLLLFVREGCSGFWELTKRLADVGFEAVHPGEVYHTLRRMEREGVLVSEPDFTGERPSLRRYGITEAGEAYIEFWAGSVEQYREEMDLFLRFYAGRTVSEAGR